MATISNPFVGILVAFASHFVLDAVPHFGQDFDDRKRLQRAVWVVDIPLTIALLCGLALTQRWELLLGAVAALSPDFPWVYRFIVDEKFGRMEPKPMGNAFNQFHAWIQKYERAPGLVVEVAYLVVIFVIFRGQI